MQIIDPSSNIVDLQVREQINGVERMKVTDQGKAFWKLPVCRRYELPKVPILFPGKDYPRNAFLSIFNKPDNLDDVFVRKVIEQTHLVGEWLNMTSRSVNTVWRKNNIAMHRVHAHSLQALVHHRCRRQVSAF